MRISALVLLALSCAPALLLAQAEPATGDVIVTVRSEGHLELVTNKRDFDFGISIFELRPDGTYLQILPYQSRASYVADPTSRRLLTPGARERLELRSIRLASHLCRAGSRLSSCSAGPRHGPADQLWIEEGCERRDHRGRGRAAHHPVVQPELARAPDPAMTPQVRIPARCDLWRRNPIVNEGARLARPQQWSN
jgi:hypothetical protein